MLNSNKYFYKLIDLVHALCLYSIVLTLFLVRVLHIILITLEYQVRNFKYRKF